MPNLLAMSFEGELAPSFDLVCLQQSDNYDSRIPDKFGSDWVIMFRRRKGPQPASEVAAAIATIQPGLLPTVPWGAVGQVPGLDYPRGLPSRVQAGKAGSRRCGRSAFSIRCFRAAARWRGRFDRETRSAAQSAPGRQLGNRSI